MEPGLQGDHNGTGPDESLRICTEAPGHINPGDPAPPVGDVSLASLVEAFQNERPDPETLRLNLQQLPDEADP
jgi:hypothetical protein